MHRNILKTLPMQKMKHKYHFTSSHFHVVELENLEISICLNRFIALNVQLTDTVVDGERSV